MCVCYFRLQRTEFEVAGGCHTCYICVTTWRCVKMRTFFFLSTKPRLSQAGALLLPKDFVSLGIRFSL